MRLIKPLRLSVLQRLFELRRERHLCIGLTAFVPFESPDYPLPEPAMWQQLAAHLGQDLAVDEGLPKPRGEFLVLGSGFAPRGEPCPAFGVSARVGPLEKALAVLGPRRWRAGVPTEPEPIAELKLGWDKAFGGP